MDLTVELQQNIIISRVYIYSWYKISRVYIYYILYIYYIYIIVVLLLSHVWLFATPWTATFQASVSSTITWSLLKFMSIELVMLSKHLILSQPFLCLQSFPSGSFPMSWLFSSVGQRIGDSALTTILPMNIQDWFPLELTDLSSLQSKRL